MVRSKISKNNLILLLLLIIGFISVGYAMLTTAININGTSKVKNAKWDVHFDNIQVTDGSVTPTTAANITADTSATFAVTLEKPGDFYEFTIDVVNAGTIDAMVGNFSMTPETVPDCIRYTATWDTGALPKAKDGILKEKSYRMKIRVEMLKDITADQLLTAEQNLTLGVQLDCVQATDELQTIAAVKYRPKYFEYGAPTTSSTTDYTTLSYLSGTKARVFVGLDADETKKSVCIIKNEILECFQFDNVARYQKDLQEVFGEGKCTVDPSIVTCQDDDLYCSGYTDGNLYCADTVENVNCFLHSDNTVTCG